MLFYTQETKITFLKKYMKIDTAECELASLGSGPTRVELGMYIKSLSSNPATLYFFNIKKKIH